MDDLSEYNSWTRESLVQKVRELEKELQESRQLIQAVLPSGPPAPPVQKQPEEGGVAQATTAKPKKRKAKGGPDPSRYTTRFVALKLAYLGKNYNGFEYQQSGTIPSIEEELWKALVKTCLVFPTQDPAVVDWSICEYSKCGRTDRGVSAFGQVVGLRIRSNKPVPRGDQQDARRRLKPNPPVSDGDGVAAGEEAQKDLTTAVAADVPGEGEQDDRNELPAEEDDDGVPHPVADEIKYCRVLNGVLPPDIRILAWCPNPPPGFSARFSCLERQYKYFFTQPAFAPMPLRPSATSTVGQVRPGFLDLEAMNTAARHFEGAHDFRNFCKIDPAKQITNYVRQVLQAEIIEVPGAESTLGYLQDPEFRAPGDLDGRPAPKVYCFHVRGSAFLWHQIRHMVAVLFLVGQGLELPSVVRDLLDVDKFPSRPDYGMAADTPLVLWDCLYGKGADRDAQPQPGAVAAADGLEWVYMVDHNDLQELHGNKGLVNSIWTNWRAKKMDELLANRFLDRVTEITRPLLSESLAAVAPSWKMVQEYAGGDSIIQVKSQYKPLAKRHLLATYEVANDKFAQRNGFASAEAMRATGQWRNAIKAAKEKKRQRDEESEE